MNYAVEQLRVWPFEVRSNNTWRPTLLDLEADSRKTVQNMSDGRSPWTVFLECVPPDSDLLALPHFNKDSDVLLFFKMYDIRGERIFYCGHNYVRDGSIVKDFILMLNERSGFPTDTELMLFEEIKPGIVKPINNFIELYFKRTYSVDKLMNGDIICFHQKTNNTDSNGSSCKEYFRNLLDQVVVTFYEKTIPNDPGFTMEISSKMKCEHLVEKLAHRIGTDGSHLRLFKSGPNKECQGKAIESNFQGSLKDLFEYTNPKDIKMIYYEQLPVPVLEFQSKKPFKFLWLEHNMEEEKEITLYLNKYATVLELLEEARNFLKLSSDTGAGHLRILEIFKNKIHIGLNQDTPIDHLIYGQSQSKQYRLEKIPWEELEIGDDEMLIPVAHFQTTVDSTFGLPFIIKIKENEPFTNTKERIQAKMGKRVEFDKLKFAIVSSGKIKYIEGGLIKLNDFKPRYSEFSTASKESRPWLGLDHMR